MIAVIESIFLTRMAALVHRRAAIEDTPPAPSFHTF